MRPTTDNNLKYSKPFVLPRCKPWLFAIFCHLRTGRQCRFGSCS